jgi:nicotinate-nucleotide adenylyltransferase
MKDVSNKINEVFLNAFGRTPLKQRLDDVLGEALELARYTDIKNMKEEVGDLLCSAIQLCNENDWTPEECINATLLKIKNREKQYKSLGRKIKVAILGGAFDPVTNGHIQVAQFVLNTSKIFDEVWLLPCYSHMYGKKMISSDDRLNMCKLAVECDKRIKVCDYEIKNKFAGQTYHFVKQLLEEDFAKNQYDFSLIIGLDNANTFEKWVEYELLEKMIRFVVVPRKGISFDPKISWYLKSPHIYLCEESPIMEISSSEVRKALIEDDNTLLQNALDIKVLEYIRNNRFYV